MSPAHNTRASSERLRTSTNPNRRTTAHVVTPDIVRCRIDLAGRRHPLPRLFPLARVRYLNAPLSANLNLTQA